MTKRTSHVMHSVDRTKYQIQIPLPPKIDASVTMMQVEEKPDVTYSDVGGCKEQIEKLREVVETPLLSVCFVAPLRAGEQHLTELAPSARAFRQARYRPTEGCSSVWSTRYWQDPLRARRSKPYRRHFHPCHRFRACTEVRWRRCSYGS